LVIAILRPEAAKKGDDQETQMTKIGRPKRRAILVMVIVFFLFIRSRSWTAVLVKSTARAEPFEDSIAQSILLDFYVLCFGLS
jgi:hypothetical protein